MTRMEELAYIVGIFNEASKWKLDETDDRDTVRLECEFRLKNLLEGSEPEPDKDGNVHNTKGSHAGKVNVCMNGKKKWIPQEWIHKVPMPGNPNGYRWEPLEEYRAEFEAKFA